jgi:SAM-dependent methyltransferase
MSKAIIDKVNNQIKTLCCSHDDIQLALDDNYFDCVVSSYSIYYANNAENIIQSIWNKLKDGGVLFYCGPSSQNNKELKKFHYSILGEEKTTAIGASMFMEGIGKDKTIEIFNKVNTTTFENILRFDSAQALYDYWSSYNLYDESIDAQFKVSAQNYFNNNSIFETVKRVIGIRAYKAISE